MNTDLNSRENVIDIVTKTFGSLMSFLMGLRPLNMCLTVLVPKKRSWALVDVL